MASSKLKMAKRLEGNGSNIWLEIDKLIAENQALNLGQGFPDFFPPDHVRQGLANTASDANPFLQQYARSSGHPRLVKALSQVYSPIFKREIDPLNEILVTIGADGSLFNTALGLINPGDEAIIIEPYFDVYAPHVKLAGGIPIFIPLKPTTTGPITSSAEWKLDKHELAMKFNKKTKLIYLNTPNNPLGKVYTQDELQLIADLCIEHDVICLADEVYEWMVYPGQKHIKIATLPGMFERTITVGSAGKTFSVTGWKLGWSIGPNYLMDALRTLHQNSIYVCPTPIQEAVGRAFEVELARFGQPDCYFNTIMDELLRKRDKMAAMLKEGGMKPMIPEGGYFMIADCSDLGADIDTANSECKDVQILKWLIRNKRISGIPISAFYSEDHKHYASSYIRFCFFKDDKTLQKAEDIIKKFKK